MRFRDFTNEESFIEEVRALANSYVKQHAAQIDANDGFPVDFMQEFAVRRLFALEKLSDDGAQLDLQSKCTLILRAIGILSVVSASAAKFVLDQNLGQVRMFWENASEDLRSTYIPQIQAGQKQMALLMTEPHTGSSPAKFKCTATAVTGGFEIQGTKDWITGGGSRTLYLVVAKSDVEPKHLGLFFVDRSYAETNRSITVSPRKRLLGLHGLGEHMVEFHKTFVPQSSVLIPFSQSSMTRIMEHYNLKRCGTAAIAIGLSEAALHCAYDYLSRRHPGPQGGIAFQNAEFDCAEMYCLIRAAEQLNAWAVEKLIRGDKTGVPSSTAKLFATETAVKITNAAIQICGANATSHEMPLERYMRDARMLTIAGGASEVLKRTIARSLPLRLAAM